MNQKSVMIVGFGVIGKSVADSLVKNKKIYSKHGIEFKVVAVTDVAGSVVNDDGIDLKNSVIQILKLSQDS